MKLFQVGKKPEHILREGTGQAVVLHINVLQWRCVVDGGHGTWKLVVTEINSQQWRYVQDRGWHVTWSWLKLRSRVSNEDMLQMEGGIVPMKLLPSRYRCSSLGKESSHGGISMLLKLLDLKLRYFNLRRLDNWIGRVPEKLLFVTFSKLRNDRFPSSGGMVPSRPI